MFKRIVQTVSLALQDPFVQGTIGLFLLARATAGLQQNLASLHEQSEAVFTQTAERMAQAAKYSAPFQPPEEKPDKKPYDGSNLTDAEVAASGIH